MKYRNSKGHVIDAESEIAGGGWEKLDSPSEDNKMPEIIDNAVPVIETPSIKKIRKKR